jgi:hypothetical protein
VRTGIQVRDITSKYVYFPAILKFLKHCVHVTALGRVRSLLGLSAFAGLIIIVIGWPLNSFITRCSIQIHKGVSASCDKRMAVLNELISAVKFIKFFAWEERWIQKTMEARGVEMEWMVKGTWFPGFFPWLWLVS